MAKHKKICKQRAAELRDEALFKDPPAKEDCPICFLPMPMNLICCISLPPATIKSVPVYDYAEANEELATKAMEAYYSCCGKSICKGCVLSSYMSGNNKKCPFCNADQDKTEGEKVEELMKRVEANDAVAMCVLGSHYIHGGYGLLQDQEKALALWKKAAELGSSLAHFSLGVAYCQRGDSKKAKFHYEVAAMAGDEVASFNLGCMEAESRNMERAIKHWTIAASAGNFRSMHNLRTFFEEGILSRESIDSTLTAYNNSCAEMRSEARDNYLDYQEHTSDRN